MTARAPLHVLPFIRYNRSRLKSRRKARPRCDAHAPNLLDYPACGQRNRKRRAAAGRASEVYRAFVHLHDLLCNGEAEAAAFSGALAALVGFIETLEDVRLVGRRDAG